jgi:trans-2,3-dihydro-3-hydroxyanthranilate isomerase
MRHRFFIADVFTDRPFAGNQLAVFPEAARIPEAAMQPIALEFNFPETTFVLPPRDPRHAARVRIFTPKAELPFAGHPTIGTAAVLVHLGLKKPSFVLEEGIGPVPIDVHDGKTYLSSDRPVETPAVKPALKGIEHDDAFFASAGVPFCFVRLKDKAAVDRAAWLPELAKAWSPNLYVFCGEKEIYARMFAPLFGIPEDPATGSGAVALASVLAGRAAVKDGTLTWTIDQGVAMRRPSRIEASAEKREGRVVRVRIGGATRIAAEGEMDVPTSLP